MKDLKAEFGAHNIVYNANPIDRWCLANTYVKADINGNIQPNKGSSATKRIDGTAALLDAYVVLREKRRLVNAVVRRLTLPFQRLLGKLTYLVPFSVMEVLAALTVPPRVPNSNRNAAIDRARPTEQEKTRGGTRWNKTIRESSCLRQQTEWIYSIPRS